MSTLLAFPSPPVPDARRLAIALDRLERSLREQRAACAAWRLALADLDVAVGGIARNLGVYEAELALAARGIDAVGAGARETASLMSAAMLSAAL